MLRFFDSTYLGNSVAHSVRNAQFFIAVANVVGVVTRLRAGLSRNRSSFPGRSKKFVSFLERPDRFWDHPASS